MKQASPAPGWAVIYPKLAENARSVGYALACHGTFGRDMDLVAIPWTSKAGKASDLVAAIVKDVAITVSGEPQRKPHGRVAYSLTTWTGPYSIDLSIMPTQYPFHTCEERPYCDACEWDLEAERAAKGATDGK